MLSLGSTQGSHFLNFYSGHVWDNLLVHAGVLSTINERSRIKAEMETGCPILSSLFPLILDHNIINIPQLYVVHGQQLIHLLYHTQNTFLQAALRI